MATKEGKIVFLGLKKINDTVVREC